MIFSNLIKSYQIYSYTNYFSCNKQTKSVEAIDELTSFLSSMFKSNINLIIFIKL